jgi:16S rRNA (uracil1498-N3)-methyltransferase
MRLTRVYLGATLTPGSVLELPPETASHVAKVLRGRAGDELIVFNGDGREFFGSIESVRGTRVTASVGGATTVDRESALSITLVQCVPRGDRMDFIIQKATELGVTRIVPVLSQRSVVRLDSAQAAAKAVHWRAVAINACEQCGRNRLPLVDVPMPLVNYLGDSTSDCPRLVLEPESRPADLPHLTSAAEIAIGPEGGFTPEELDALHIANFVKIRLGPRILRTETAAIAAMTWLQTRYGDMRLGA